MALKERRHMGRRFLPAGGTKTQARRRQDGTKAGKSGCTRCVRVRCAARKTGNG